MGGEALAFSGIVCEPLASLRRLRRGSRRHQRRRQNDCKTLHFPLRILASADGAPRPLGEAVFGFVSMFRTARANRSSASSGLALSDIGSGALGFCADERRAAEARRRSSSGGEADMARSAADILGKLPFSLPEHERRRYWLALGRFVDAFSRVESLAMAVFWRLTGLDIPTARALFSGVRLDAAKDNIRRLLEVQQAPKMLRDEVSAVFAQLTAINAARNDLLHYGPQDDGQGGMLATNRLVAHDQERAREGVISAEVLDTMSEDLAKIELHLLAHLWSGLVPSEDLETIQSEARRRAWRYKPAAPSRVRRPHPANSRLRPPPP
jgi:hypothetical protein